MFFFTDHKKKANSILRKEMDDLAYWGTLWSYKTIVHDQWVNRKSRIYRAFATVAERNDAGMEMCNILPETTLVGTWSTSQLAWKKLDRFSRTSSFYSNKRRVEYQCNAAYIDLLRKTEQS